MTTKRSMSASWENLSEEEAAAELWPEIMAHWNPRGLIDAIEARWQRHVHETLDRIFAELPK